MLFGGNCISWWDTCLDFINVIIDIIVPIFASIIGCHFLKKRNRRVSLKISKPVYTSNDVLIGIHNNSGKKAKSNINIQVYYQPHAVSSSKVYYLGTLDNVKALLRGLSNISINNKDIIEKVNGKTMIVSNRTIDMKVSISELQSFFEKSDKKYKPGNKDNKYYAILSDCIILKFPDNYKEFGKVIIDKGMLLNGL